MKQSRGGGGVECTRPPSLDSHRAPNTHIVNDSYSGAPGWAEGERRADDAHVFLSEKPKECVCVYLQEQKVKKKKKRVPGVFLAGVCACLSSCVRSVRMGVSFAFFFFFLRFCHCMCIGECVLVYVCVRSCMCVCY